MTQTRIVSVEELEGLRGEIIFESDWFTVTQERIAQFAEVTDDDQYIHVDPDACSDGRGFMGRSGTVAHGKLTSSLAVGRMVKGFAVADHQFVNMRDETEYKRPVPAGWELQVRGGIVSIVETRKGLELIVVLFVDVREPSKERGKRAAVCKVTVLTRAI